MKNFMIFIIALLLFIGCSTEGDLKIINQTNHNLYAQIKNKDYVIEGNDSQVFSFDTGSKIPIFEGDQEKNISLILEGETFMMQEAYSDGEPTGDFFTETKVKITSNKTLKVYANATHASIKIHNHGTLPIHDLIAYQFELAQNTCTDTIFLCETIEPTSDFWEQIPATNETEPDFRYTFEFLYDGGYYIYDVNSDIQDILLYLDDQYIIEFTP